MPSSSICGNTKRLGFSHMSQDMRLATQHMFTRLHRMLIHQMNTLPTYAYEIADITDQLPNPIKRRSWSYEAKLTNNAIEILNIASQMS